MENITPFVKALGFTLVHSTWQITTIALMMSFLLFLMDKRKASARYILSLSALGLSLLVAVITFLIYLPGSKPAADVTTLVVSANHNLSSVSLADVPGITDTLNVFLYNNLEWICLIWGLGMMVFLVRILAGWYGQYRILITSKPLQTGWLSEKMLELKTKAKCVKSITLRVTDRIYSPAVMGWLKPCIYFPVSLVNQLSIEDAESILAHELAHIIRNDYWINILQHFIEALFYYHPGIWWISSHIRNERENACDDLAVNIMGDRIHYAKSLIFLQEWQNEHVNPILAMNIASPTSPLFNRIMRILKQPKHKNDMKQKLWAALILVSAFLWTAATYSPANNESQKSNESAEEIRVEKSEIIKITLDTVPPVKEKTQSKVIEIKDGQI